MEERVQKILARAGLASRRQAEELIKEGLVTINGKVAKLGDKAHFGKDAIKVRGKLLHQVESKVYLLLHKPKGVISMLVDPENRPTLADYLKGVDERVFPVGRLDFNSTGLILLTNDGDFAERIQRSNDLPRIYHVKVKGHPSPEQMARLEKGGRITLPEPGAPVYGKPKTFKPGRIRVLEKLANKSRIEVLIVGAHSVDLKAYFETRGFLVEAVTRAQIGHMTLHDLRPGEFRRLKPSQAEALLKQPELGLIKHQHESEKADEKQARRDRFEERKAELESKGNRSEAQPKRRSKGFGAQSFRSKPNQSTSWAKRKAR